MDHAGGYEEYAFIADLYDHVVPYRERQDVAFFVEAAQESGGPVLEIGCGTGRILIPMARAGVEVVGLDLSPHMLQVCRERVQRESEDVQSRIQLVQADMRSFSLAQSFKLVTTPFRPFQHLTTVAVACAEAFGFRLSRINGSHHIYVHADVPELVNLQNVNGQAKPYQIRQLLRLIERYNLQMEDGT